MSYNSVTFKWINALVLAVGLGTVWGFVLVVVGAIVGSLLPAGEKTYENIVVVTDGTPLIQARIGNNWLNTQLRSLSGETVELDRENWLGGASFPKPYREPGIMHLPITWRERIAGISDSQKSPANWVLIRNDERPGHAYFVGYDSFSKLRLGYIGRRGFRPSLPPQEDWFDLGNSTLTWGSGIATSAGYLNYSSLGYYYGGGSRVAKGQLANWLVFLIAGEDLLEIDLLKREVRIIKNLDQLLSVAVASQPLTGAEDDQSLQPDESDGQAQIAPSPFRLVAMQSGVFFYTAAPIDANRKTTHRLVARCVDRLVVINPFDDSQQEFLLPKWLRQRSFTVYAVSANQLLLQISQGWWEQGSVADLLWINTDGEEMRKETLRLTGYGGGESYLQFLATAAVVPALLPWLIAMLGVGPLGMLQTHKVENYVAGLRESLAFGWPAFVLVVLLSLVLAWVVYRWQKKYYRSHTRLWTATVLFTTLPGLLAYWAMHRRPPVAACEACGQEVPRDRDACPNCQQPFAEPALLGTEILA